MTPSDQRRCFDDVLRALHTGAIAGDSRLLRLDAAERDAVLAANVATERVRPLLLNERPAPSARVLEALRVSATLQAACATRQIAVVFPKTLQHYPDMGHDIDLWTMAAAPAMAWVTTEFEARPLPSGVFGGLAGKRSYAIAGSRTPLEVHHGGVGHLGEHRELLVDVLRGSRHREVEGASLCVPSDEDQLVVQAMQRMLGHFSARASDVFLTVTLVSRPLDWARVRATAGRHGLAHALGLWLAICRDVWASATGVALPEPAQALAAARAPRLLAQGYICRMPMPALAVQLYARLAGHALRRGRWRTLGRVATLPAAVAAFGVVAAGRSLSRAR